MVKIQCDYVSMREKNYPKIVQISYTSNISHVLTTSWW
jgi:hypothetical protein